MFGFDLSLPAASRFSCHLLFMARPPRWIASDEPVVAEPMAVSPFCTPQRWEMMDTQRACMAIMAGYSSASLMFLDRFSTIKASASRSIYKDFGVSIACHEQEIELQDNFRDQEGALAPETWLTIHIHHHEGRTSSNMYVRRCQRSWPNSDWACRPSPTRLSAFGAQRLRGPLPSGSRIWKSLPDWHSGKSMA